jgi:hypothetical protein
MQGQIRKQKSKIAAALLGVGACLFVSCASQKEQVALVKDPDAKADSMIPWNKQEKWETQSQLGGITDRR